MTFSPGSFLAVRALFQRRTELSANALGIQHFSAQGGGYHEGNDLLRAGGREDTDYSKRESTRDRPGSNAACAIDIGRFRVQSATGWVDNHRMTRWFLGELAQGAPDTRWIREIIYSLDDVNVKRYDALNIREKGDSSHRTHEHFSSFRDDVDSPHILGVFERFWSAMDGKAPVQTPPSATVQRKGLKMFAFYFFTPAVGAQTPLWGFGIIDSVGTRSWLEANNEGEATGYARGTGLSATTLDRATYTAVRAKFGVNA